MAVNKITNKQVVTKESINRADQISTRNTTQRQGNRAASVLPGLDYTKNYAITLKDVDTSVIKYIKNVLRPKISEANEMVDVPVMYGNEERWVAVRKNGVNRDKNNSLILPLIMLKRTSIGKNELSTQGFEHDIQMKYARVTRNSRWSKDNQYDRFSVLTGTKPVTENIITGMPNFSDVTYEFILWTAYIEQMNSLIELFVSHSNKYWGDSNNYKFLSTLDSIDDATEMSIDSERFVKSTFSVTTRAYLLPEYMNSTITNKMSTTKRELTPGKVVFGFEGDATNEQVGK
jgi:hypothetical protein